MRCHLLPNYNFHCRLYRGLFCYHCRLHAGVGEKGPEKKAHGGQWDGPGGGGGGGEKNQREPLLRRELQYFDED